MTAMPDVAEPWCAVPVYNNAATIADIARRCRAQLSRVIVVDDGSRDADLRDLLKDLDVIVLRHPVNRGKGAALETAFQYAAGRGARQIITLDGDGQHFPEDIPLFLPHLSPDTILIGRRRDVVGTMPRSSHFGRDFSDFWIEVETGIVVSDSQSGFRAYPLARVLSLPISARHYNFEMEVITRAIWVGLKVQSVPIRVWYPEKSERVSSFRPFVDNLRISLIHARLVARQLLLLPKAPLSGAIACSAPPLSFTSPGTPGEAGRGSCFNENPLSIGPIPIPPPGIPGEGEMRSDVCDCPAPVCDKAPLRGQNSKPIGLSAAAAIGVFFGTVLWPFGIVLVLYLAWRLHLNKIMSLAAAAICLLPPWTRFGAALGATLLPGSSAHLQWFVGSHIVAFTAAAAVAIGVYLVSQRWHHNDERS